MSSTQETRDAGSVSMLGVDVSAPPVPGRPRAAFREPSLMLAREMRYRRLLGVADAIAISGALAIAALAGDARLEPAAVIAPLLLVVIAKLAGLYDRDAQLLHKSTLDEVPRLFALATFATLLVFLADGLIADDPFGRGQIALVWLTLFGLMLALRPVARVLARDTTTPERCLFVGDASRAEEFRENLASTPSVKAELVGWIPVTQVGDASRDAPAALAGRIRELIEERAVQRVIIGPDPGNNDRLLNSIREIRDHGVRVSVLPDVSRVVRSALELDRLSGLTLLGVRRFEITHSSRVIKRGFDIAGATLGLLLALPLLIVVAVAIKLDSGGPVTFRQKRAGRHGEPFQMLKLRSMVLGAEEMQKDLEYLNEAEGVFKIADDPRVTRVGKLIRCLHVDELPQLVNVVRGEMSLVGPRPLPLDEDRRIEGWHRRRLDVRPGITGPWQVLGSAKIPVREMVRLDYQYVADWSLWNDIRILLLTAGHMLRRRGV